MLLHYDSYFISEAEERYNGSWLCWTVFVAQSLEYELCIIYIFAYLSRVVGKL